ncbi:hypothetical protein F5879DRAFT_138270 [Lentinula edodes]|nr:hypothetical protein F5879DRAFT_138270 [Lentinula edodes]
MPKNSVPSATSKTAANRTLAQSWAALPASTRVKFSLGICAVAAAGIYLSDVLEKRMSAEPREKSD